MARQRRGHGEGSLFQRKDGRWVGRISMGYDGSGKRRSRSVYGKTKREAQQKLQALQQQKAAGDLVPVNRMTVAQFMDGWLETTAANTVSGSTLRRYRGIVKHQIAGFIGQYRLSRLRPDMLRQWYSDLRKAGHSDRTLRMAHAVLRRALTTAVRERLIPQNPCTLVDAPRYKAPGIRPLEAEQVRDLMKAAEGHRDAPLIIVALMTGMRQGELFGLHWRDVDLQAPRLVVRHSVEYIGGTTALKQPKTRAGRRTISLPATAVEALNDQRKQLLVEGLAGCDLVFPSAAGTFRHNTSFCRRTWARLRKLAGLPKGTRFHDLRHTHATMLLTNGVHPKVVQQRLGHATISTTMDVYSHVMPELDTEAATKLDGLLLPDPGMSEEGYKTECNSGLPEESAG